MSEKKMADYGFLREAFMVKRYHTTMNVNMPERVGHHTANVIAILFFLFEDHPPLYLVRHALHHDAPELVTGDLPAPTKWRHPNLAKAAEQVERAVVDDMGLESGELDPLHRDLLKYADMMDLCFKSVEEMATGNDCFMPILVNGLVYCKGLLEGSLKEHVPAQALYVLLESNRYINIKEVYNDRETTTATKH